MRTVRSVVYSECLVLSAALAVFGVGCSDAETDSGGTAPPPYSVSGERPFTGPGAGEQPPQAPGDGSPAPTPSTEGQTPDNLPIAPGTDTGSTDNGNGSGNAPSPAPSGDSGNPPVQPGDMSSGNEQMPPPAQPPVEPQQPPEPPAPPPPPPLPPPLDCNAPRPQLTGGTQACNVNANGGVDAGQSWFMWYDGSNGCMTPFEGYGGAFRANWNNSGDFLARMGLFFDQTRTHEQIGELYAELAFTRTGSAGGFSYLGVYGWSTNPLVEYYIVEDSFNNAPATPFNTQQRGTFTVDGSQYRIFTGQRNNVPSIVGTANFVQVFSVRQSPRNCGRVSVSQHFRQWESLGIDLGNLYEARVLVEAGGGTGSATFTTARVLIDD